MEPKPPPPTSLLLPWQEWTVVPSVNWMLAEGHQKCYFVTSHYTACREPAVVRESSHTPFASEGLCLEHMGSFQWFDDDGNLMQWRATPPYSNKPVKKYERWRSARTQRHGQSGNPGKSS